MGTLFDTLQQKQDTNELPSSVGLRKLHKFLTQYRRTGPRVETATPTQKPRRTNKHKKQRPATPPRVTPWQQTRLNKTYDIGTIIRKQFPNKKYYEGKITDYDPRNKLYHIKYLDDDTEELTPAEVKQYTTNWPNDIPNNLKHMRQAARYGTQS